MEFLPEERHVCDEGRGAAQGEDAGNEVVFSVFLPHGDLANFRQ